MLSVNGKLCTMWNWFARQQNLDESTTRLRTRIKWVILGLLSIHPSILSFSAIVVWVEVLIQCLISGLRSSVCERGHICSGGWVKLLHGDPTSKGISKLLHVPAGIHQGRTILPLFFFTMYTVTQDIHRPATQKLLYADLIFLASGNKADLEQHILRSSYAAPFTIESK